MKNGVPSLIVELKRSVMVLVGNLWTRRGWGPFFARCADLHALWVAYKQSNLSVFRFRLSTLGVK